jgi:hypothetical protein
MIISAIKDTSSFLILLSYTTIAYSTLFKILEHDSNEGVIDTLKLAFELNLGNFNSEKYSIGQYIIFIVAGIMNLIIMLNLLISILGDSYDKVQFTMTESDYEQKIEVVIEIEKMMIWNRNKKINSYIHRCDLYRNEFSEADWEGRIRILQDSLLQITTQINQSKQDLQINLEKKMIDSQKELKINFEKKMAEYHNELKTDLEQKMDKIYHLLQVFTEGSQPKP